MKVKNIMFSGFAAAVLAGACGAADAATYTLASKDYVTNQLKTKEHTLTTGDGITITRETDTEGNITSATISADLSTVTVEGADGSQVPVSDALTDLTQSVTAVEDKLGDLPENTTVADALDEKQDALSNASVLESIDQETVDSIGETAGAVAGLETTVGNAESGLVKDVADLKNDIATKAEAQALTDGLALKENVANKLTGESVTEADLTAEKYMSALTISKYVQGELSGALDEGGAVTKAVEDAIDNAVKNGEVGTAIEAAVANKQDKLTFDATPTADSANPVTSGGVYTALSGKANTSDIPTDYVTDSEFETYQGTVTTALEGKQATIADLETIKAGAALGATALQEIANNSVTEAMLATDVQTSLGAADTAVQPGANVSTLTNDAKYQTESDVSATIDAGNYLSDTMTEDGSYLVTKKGDAVSYASVSVIDGQGNVMTLQ